MTFRSRNFARRVGDASGPHLKSRRQIQGLAQRNERRFARKAAGGAPVGVVKQWALPFLFAVEHDGDGRDVFHQVAHKLT